MTPERKAQLKQVFVPIYEATVMYEVLEALDEAEARISSLEKQLRSLSKKTDMKEE